MQDAETVPDLKSDPRNRLAAGFFFAMWAVVGWASLSTNRQIVGVDFGQDPGPGLMPAIVLALLSAGSLVLIAAGLAGLIRHSNPALDWRSMVRRTVLPAFLLLTLLGYVPFVRRVGFLPASTAFAACWMALLAADELRRDPFRAAMPILLGTAAGVGLIYFVFIYWIGVPLR
jgi:hypothetical protein